MAEWRAKICPTPVHRELSIKFLFRHLGRVSDRVDPRICYVDLRICYMDGECSEAASDLVGNPCMVRNVGNVAFDAYSARENWSSDRCRYGISSVAEARAYLACPVLGYRYRECVYALGWLGEMASTNVVGEESAAKVHASLTLFAEASGEPLFRTMLAVLFDNMVDENTIARLDPV